MKSKIHNRHWKYFGILALAAIIVMALVVLWEFIDILLLSLALAYIIYPVAKKISRGKTERGLPYLLSSLTAVLIVAIPLILVTIYALNFVLHWVIQNLPAIKSGSFMLDLKVGLDNMGLGIVSERIATETGKLIAGFTEVVSASILRPTWLVEFFLKIAVFFVATFYFVYEGPHVRRLLDKYIPPKEKFLRELVFRFDKICYGLFVGHFFTSVIIALIAGVGFWLILKPGVITLSLLTVVMFVIAFLPVIGPWFMYIPMVIWQMFFVPGGASQGIALLIFSVIFLTFIPDFYIRPKLVQRGSELHPLLLILGFFGGPLIMGLKGIIIGPLILGLAQAIMTLYIEKRHILRELIEHF